MRLMEQILADIVWSKCLVYLDDIVAFCRTFKGVLINLQAVLKRLSAVNVNVKLKKCDFIRTEVEYLGHRVSRGNTLS